MQEGGHGSAALGIILYLVLVLKDHTVFLSLPGSSASWIPRMEWLSFATPSASRMHLLYTQATMNLSLSNCELKQTLFP